MGGEAVGWRQGRVGIRDGDRLKAGQAEGVYGGLAFGVRESDDRLLLCAKVGGNLVGVAEVALPNGKRVGGYSSYEPTAPGESPYVSDVCVAPNQRGRGIGKYTTLRAHEARQDTEWPPTPEKNNQKEPKSL